MPVINVRPNQQVIYTNQSQNETDADPKSKFGEQKFENQQISVNSALNKVVKMVYEQT